MANEDDVRSGLAQNKANGSGLWIIALDALILALVVGIFAQNLAVGAAAFFVIAVLFYVPSMKHIVTWLMTAAYTAAAYGIAVAADASAVTSTRRVSAAL